MDYKKRAVLYLLRKKGNTAGIFLLITTVSIFLLSCFALLNASGKLAGDIRGAVGAEFYIRARMGVVSDGSGETTIMERHIRITDSEIERILSCGDIAYCNPVNYGYAKGEGLSFIPGEKHSEDNNMGRITALRYSAPDAGFADKTLSLAEGKHITAADTGSVLISSALAAANDLSVGDSLTLLSSELGETGGEYVDAWHGDRKSDVVTIIGIYDIITPLPNLTATAGRQENRIYASLDVLTALCESEQSVYTGEVGFYVTDPRELEPIVSKVRQIDDIDWETHFIRTNDLGYSEIADGLLKLGGLIKLLLVCVSAVSAAILTLALTLRIKARVPETGILLGAGITKREIIKQFLLEVLIVAAAAFVFSYAVSPPIIRMLGENMLTEPDIISAAELQNGMSGAVDTRGYLSLGIWRILLIYGCQLAAAVGCVFISSVPVLRLKPKEILTRMS